MVIKTAGFFKKPNKVLALLFVSYFMILGLVLLQFPLNGSFCGNIDMWLTVWQMNDLYLDVTSGHLFGQVMYPTKHLSALIDSPVGLGIFYVPLKFLIHNDIWVFYLMTVVILSLNALSCFLLLRVMNVNVRIAALLGLLFASSNFVLSQLENFNSFGLFPALFSLYFLLKAAEVTGKRNYYFVFISALFAGMQVYFSIYLFLFQFVLIAPVAIASGFFKQYGKGLIWMGLLLLIAFPFLMNHQHVPHHIADALLRFMQPDNEQHSISLVRDYFRVNSGNIIYPKMDRLDTAWKDNARSAFFGISTYVLLLVALVHYFRNRSKMIFALLVVIVVSAIASTGPVMTIFSMKFLSPVGLVNKFFPQTLMLRHMFRIHHFVILSGLIIIGCFLQVVYERNAKAGMLIAVLFTMFYLLENIPFRATLYSSDEIRDTPEELVYILDQIAPAKNLMFLPACTMVITPEDFQRDIIPITREYLYMNWKNDLHHNIYNGRMAYLGDVGFMNNVKLCYLDDANFKELQEENDIDYFVVAHEFATEKFNAHDLPVLLANTELVEQTDKFTLLKNIVVNN